MPKKLSLMGTPIIDSRDSPFPNYKRPTMAAGDRIALITGAGSGIGQATALAFLNDGYHVVLSGRHKESLDETASMAGSAGKNALAVTADGTAPGAGARLFP